MHRIELSPLRWLRVATAGALAASTLASVAFAQAPSEPAACSARSGAQTVALAELYTSEGCSSCPPADVWLSSLAKQGLGLDKVVPLGLHVDYWDYIGWKDEFATATITERQRDWAKSHRARFVYTPQVVLAGQDYRAWSDGGIVPDVKRVNATPARASLSLNAMPTKNTIAVTGSVNVPNVAERGDTKIYLALSQNSIATPVKRGENAGATLKHDHVVREWIGPLQLGADGKLELDRRLTLPKSAKPGDLRLTLIAQRGGEVLQVLALPLQGAACGA